MDDLVLFLEFQVGWATVHRDGERQVRAARGLPVDWHAAEQGAMRFFKKIIPSRERIRFVYTPAK